MGWVSGWGVQWGRSSVLGQCTSALLSSMLLTLNPLLQAPSFSTVCFPDISPAHTLVSQTLVVRPWAAASWTWTLTFCAALDAGTRAWKGKAVPGGDELSGSSSYGGKVTNPEEAWAECGFLWTFTCCCTSDLPVPSRKSCSFLSLDFKCSGQLSQQRGQTQHTIIFGWSALALGQPLWLTWKLCMEMVRAAPFCVWAHWAHARGRSVCRQVVPRWGVGSVLRAGSGVSTQTPLHPAPALPSSRGEPVLAVPAAGLCSLPLSWRAACPCLGVSERGRS